MDQFRPPPSPATPLNPISPERINQRKMTGTPPVTPEFAQVHNRHERSSSDVQAKVAFLNSLSHSRTNGQSPVHSSSSTTTAALQRAILGREEAESALQSTMTQLSEANARERRVSERLESLMDEIHSLKERQSHERVVFEKEVRKARKEAFRAGSTVVKAQEELKYSRSELKTLRDQVQSEKEAKDKANQEAFERAYALAGLTEELQVLKDRLRSLETDNQSDVLEARAEEMRGESPTKRATLGDRRPGSCTPTPSKLRRSQLATLEPRASARKHSGTPQSARSSTLGSPVKMWIARQSSCKENQDPTLADAEDDILEELKGDLQWEQKLRKQAEEMVYFMKMECQFQRCSCRIAERQGIRYVHDTVWDTSHKMHSHSENSIDQIPITPQPSKSGTTMPSEPEEIKSGCVLKSVEPTPMDVQQTEPLLTYCPDSGTFESMQPKKEEDIEPAFTQVVNNHGTDAPILDSFRQESANPSTPNPLDTDDVQPMEVVEDVQPTLAEQSQLVEGTDRPNQIFTHSAPTVKSQPRPKSLQFEIGHNANNEEFHDNNEVVVTSEYAATTTTVPLRDENSKSTKTSNVPGTPVSREQALAQIRARRGRTQSALKRSVSANDAGSRGRLYSASTTPIRGSRRIPRVENSDGRISGFSRRDVSASSHPY